MEEGKESSSVLGFDVQHLGKLADSSLDFHSKETIVQKFYEQASKDPSPSSPLFQEHFFDALPPLLSLFHSSLFSSHFSSSSSSSLFSLARLSLSLFAQNSPPSEVLLVLRSDMEMFLLNNIKTPSSSSSSSVLLSSSPSLSSTICVNIYFSVFLEMVYFLVLSSSTPLRKARILLDTIPPLFRALEYYAFSQNRVRERGEGEGEGEGEEKNRKGEKSEGKEKFSMSLKIENEAEEKEEKEKENLNKNLSSSSSLSSQHTASFQSLFFRFFRLFSLSSSFTYPEKYKQSLSHIFSSLLLHPFSFYFWEISSSLSLFVSLFPSLFSSRPDLLQLVRETLLGDKKKLSWSSREKENFGEELEEEEEGTTEVVSHDVEGAAVLFSLFLMVTDKKEKDDLKKGEIENKKSEEEKGEEKKEKTEITIFNLRDLFSPSLLLLLSSKAAISFLSQKDWRKSSRAISLLSLSLPPSLPPSPLLIPFNHDQIEQSPFFSLFQSLSSFLAQCPNPAKRQDAHAMITRFVKVLNPPFRFELFERIVTKCPFPNVQSAWIDLFRNEVCGALDEREKKGEEGEERQGEADNCFYCGKEKKRCSEQIGENPFTTSKVVKMIEELLKQRVATQDLLDGQDVTISTLNLFRFVTIRDRENKTGVRERGKEIFSELGQALKDRIEAEVERRGKKYGTEEYKKDIKIMRKHGVDVSEMTPCKMDAVNDLQRTQLLLLIHLVSVVEDLIKKE